MGWSAIVSRIAHAGAARLPITDRPYREMPVAGAGCGRRGKIRMSKTGCSGDARVAAIEIGSRRELFVDHLLIDKMQGVGLRMHEPRKMPMPESPLSGHYMTVIKDGGLFRAYCRRYKPNYRGEKKDGNRGECVCYLESRDGVEWEEPDLGLLEDGDFGTYKNAIFDRSPFAHNFSPFLDEKPGVPDRERYKALAGTRDTGLHAFVSGDGIRWRKMGQEAVIPHNPELHGRTAFDSQNVAFWSHEEGCYVSYFRHLKALEGGPRSITRATSRDFMKWHDETPAFKTPNLPGEELYTSQTHPYFRAPHIYVALPTRFTRGYLKGIPIKGGSGNLINVGSTDVMLMTSRAGAAHFDRPFKEAFIRPGPVSAAWNEWIESMTSRAEPAPVDAYRRYCPDLSGWDNRANYVALNVVPTGPGEMSLYNRTGHRYVLRTDGFASVNAPYEGGEFLTRPVSFTGSELKLNYSTSIAGWIRIEVLDISGRPIAGYEISEPICGDETDAVVHWPGRESLGNLEGRPIRLRFVMKDADLYALRFCR